MIYFSFLFDITLIVNIYVFNLCWFENLCWLIETFPLVRDKVLFGCISIICWGQVLEVNFSNIYICMSNYSFYVCYLYGYMYMYMCVCLYTYVYVYMCVWVCMYVCMYICIWICSIRGTNNQIWNRFYKSVHLQLFNVKCKLAYFQLLNIKYKFIQLQLSDVKCLFSKEHIFRKEKRTDVHGHTSLASGFQLNRENDANLWDTNKFLRSHILCTNILKCEFQTKGMELTRLEFFEGPRGTWFRPFL